MVKGFTITSKNARSLIDEAIQKMRENDSGEMRDALHDYTMRQIKGLKPKKLAGMRIVCKKKST